MQYPPISLIGSNGKANKLTLSVRSFIKALAADGNNVPRWEIVAYTGGLLTLDNLSLPVVIDLTDTIIAPRVPLLYLHCDEDVVGHTENLTITLPNTIKCIGVGSGTGERAVEVKSTSQNGFPWNVSVGVDCRNLIRFNEGQSFQANGKTWYGPCFLAKKNSLREISFVPMGADATAYARLIAKFGASAMTYEEWLASIGVDPTTLTPVEVTLAKKIYDALMANQQQTADTNAANTAAANAAAAANNLNATAAANADATTITAQNAATVLNNLLVTHRNNVADFQIRIDRINSLSAQYGHPKKDGITIAATAIKENWTIEKSELQMVLAARPQGVQAGGGNNGVSSFRILEAALAVAGKIDKPERFFTVQELDVAHKRFKARIGLQQFLLEAARANGYSGEINVKANLKQILQAAFSSIDLPNILVSNINRYLIEGYTSVDDSWRKLARIGSVPDFKEQSGYRGVGSFKFEPLAPTGRIKHGAVSETPFGNKAATYAKMFGVSRPDIINDDLGFFTSVPRGLGRGGALSLVDAFWIEFLDNSAFFTAGHGNTSAGAFGLTGLANANVKFKKLTDENGDYIFATPKFVVVPTELEDQAMSIYNDTQIITGENVTKTSGNPYGRKFEPISSPYLSDSRYTGFSTTAFYLIADPNDIPTIEVVFLDGVETPTVESADVDFSQLGIQFRGYFDFGVRLQDYRGGVRSTGV